MHGLGEFHGADGTYYKGTYEQGMMHGKGILKTKAGGEGFLGWFVGWFLFSELVIRSALVARNI